MTMLQPGTTGFVARALNSVSLKTALAAVISVTAWHYTDSGKIDSNHQEIVEQGTRIDFQRDALSTKIDRETYLADQKELHDDLREIRNAQTETNKLLLERLP